MQQAMRGPLKIEIVGLFPEFYRLCPKGANYLGACGLEPDASQVSDYPEAIQAMGHTLEDLYVNIMRDFGDRIFPVSVGLASLRGLILAWKHRLSSDEVYVVVGGRPIPASRGYAAVRDALREALGEPATEPRTA